MVGIHFPNCHLFSNQPLLRSASSGAFKLFLVTLSLLVHFRSTLVHHHKLSQKSSKRRHRPFQTRMALSSTPLPTHPHPLFFSAKRSRFQVLEFCVFRRRRLKTIRALPLPSEFGHLLDNVISLFPFENSLQFIAPLTLGFASGVSLQLSRLKQTPPVPEDETGEWILFTSPTPFNRFVLLRCPSIAFVGSELLEDVNEKLVKEDRHFVRLDSGRITIIQVSTEEEVERLEYQRVCVGTEDGGVISLDWPANLDLKEEHGLDTTLLLVPGTPQGSLDTNLRSFVCEALKRGFFPVVMNPRGCAGSPLTTAR